MGPNYTWCQNLMQIQDVRCLFSLFKMDPKSALCLNTIIKAYIFKS